ncbi:MAG: FkbM family methyltransferase [Planctomycetota bacterium]
MSRFVKECFLVSRLLGPIGAVRWALGGFASAATVLRTRSLASADEFLGHGLTLRCGDRRLQVSDADFGVCREILGHDCYRLASCAGQLRTAIDLGANCGIFTLMAATLNPQCRILAVEVNPGLATATIANAARNGFANRVTVINQLVGVADDPTVRILMEKNPTITMFDPREAVRQLGGCDFLKCDVEGGEHALFAGDLSWLQGVRRLAIEYHWTEAEGARLARLIESAGFTVEQKPHRNLGYVFGVAK